MEIFNHSNYLNVYEEVSPYIDEMECLEEAPVELFFKLGLNF